ncbi:MAG: toprim domain-containing protein [Victivallaceae bacterium]|nr:toprim domain-containing protein [Victivallaceae bacterium]
MNYSPEIIEEIQRALINDSAFEFKQSGRNLRYGVCPNCGARECFVNLDQPFKVTCGRLNNCRWSASTRELYPEIFDNISHRHPVTDAEPDAPADAYMREVRGFDLAKIKGMYHLGYVKNKNKEEFYPAVKIAITKDCYWCRLIDAESVRKNGAKSKIVGDYKDLCWMPDGMTVEKNDTIWIVEGIFKAMALLCIGVKAVSSLSCSNFPRQLIRANAGRGVTWVIAEDADKAGMDAAKKYRAELAELGETCRIAFPEKGEDWDDAFRAGKLTKPYLQDSFWRGYYYMAETALAKAFFHFFKTQRGHHVFALGFALYRYKVELTSADAGELADYPDPTLGWNVPDDRLSDLITKFSRFCEVREICPARLTFLYIEQDILTQERLNCLQVEFANGTPSMLMSADGTIYKSVDNFSNAILKATGFAPFTGKLDDLAELHRTWFRNRVKFVQSVPFMGYEIASQIYVFPDFAYYKGQFQKVNDYGYVEYNRHSLKCNLAGLTIVKQPDEFTGDWIGDYVEAFDLNGLVLLGWWLGTLFAEQVRSRQDSWTFLEYTGEPGSGKSTQIKFCWRLLGIDNHEGFDPNKTTPAGRARQMTQVSNLPVVLLEGDREENSLRKNMRSFDFNELKDMFNQAAVIRTTGVKTGGNETAKLTFRGGVLITQNAEVKASPAVLSRIVHCHVTKSHFTKHNAELADRLKQMTARELGGFLHAALRNEPRLLTAFYSNYQKLRDDFDRRNASGEVPEFRLRHCHAQIGAWIMALPILFGTWLKQETIDAAIDHLWERAKERQSRLSSDHPALERFWEIYDYIHTARDSNGDDIEKLNHASKRENLIAINMPEMTELAAQHRLNLPDPDELTTLFKGAKLHHLVGYKTVRSALNGRMIKCWVFERDA